MSGADPGGAGTAGVSEGTPHATGSLELTVRQIDGRGTVGGRSRHNGEVPEMSGPGLDDLTDEERAQREADLRALIELMRPAVQADGGDLELVSFDVETGVVEVQLQGACSSCAISSATLQGGVERILRGRLDWVTEVVGRRRRVGRPLRERARMGRGAATSRRRPGLTAAQAAEVGLLDRPVAHERLEQVEHRCGRGR